MQTETENVFFFFFEQQTVSVKRLCYKDKFTRAVLEPATSGLTCRCSLLHMIDMSINFTQEYDDLAKSVAPFVNLFASEAV